MTMQMMCIITSIWCHGASCWIPKAGFSNAYHIEQLVEDPHIWIIAGIESRYDANAISSVGALGLYQIMPIAEKHVNQLYHLKLSRTNMLDNIQLGKLYYEYLMSRFDGDHTLSLVAYQWGTANAVRYREGQTSLPVSTQRYLNEFTRVKNKCIKP